MTWKVAFVVALLTAFVTAIVTIIVATYVAERYGVSDRDGGRTMSIFFFLAPIAFIVGILFGLMGTYYVGATAWAQFWQATGASVGSAMVVILAIAGYFLLSAPATSKAGVSPFVVQVEVYIPLDRISAHPEEHSPMQMTLTSGPMENSSVIIDTAHTFQENGKLVVTGAADLESISTSRVLSFFLDENSWMELQNLQMVASPSGTAPVWSELMPMRDVRTEEPHGTAVQARVRVLKRELTK